jgi:hypothetical protein
MIYRHCFIVPPPVRSENTPIEREWFAGWRPLHRKLDLFRSNILEIEVIDP